MLSSFLIITLFYNEIGLNNFTLLVVIFISSLMYQILKFKKNNSKKCLEIFRSLFLTGFLLFFGILLIN